MLKISTFKFNLSLGIIPEDTDEVRLQKRLLNFIGIGTTIPGLIWAFVYFLSGEPLVALLPLFYSILGISLLVMYGNKPYLYATIFMIFRLMILFIPALIMFALGGFTPGSVAIIWGLMAPLTTLLIGGQNNARKWFLGYILLVIAASVIPPIRTGNDFSEIIIALFFVINILGMSITTFIMTQFAVNERNRFKDQAETLLLNVLPKEVIPHLRKTDQPYVEEFESVSVLFADIVGFTKLTETLGARDMLELLNEIFSYFDSLLEEHHAEKIRTIGDNYMLVVGAPVKEEDHAYYITSMAKKMLKFLNNDKMKANGVSFRIGINSGPVVAGVIGKHKFHFDVWGDVVNVASRFESHGEPNKIQIGESTFSLIKDRIECEERGEIELKGKGKIKTWFVK